MALLSTISPELFEYLFSFLDLGDLFYLRSVSKAFEFECLRRIREAETIRFDGIRRPHSDSKLGSFVTCLRSFCNRDAVKTVALKTLNDKSLLEIVEIFPQTTSLSLCGCTALTSTCIISSLSRLNSLEFLDLSRTESNDRVLDAIATRTTLQNLCISGCRKFTSAGLGALSRLPNISHLDVSGVRTFTDECALALPFLPQLVSVDFSHTRITSQTVVAVATMAGAGLKEWCSAPSPINDEGVIALATHCPNLEKVSLSHCHQISDESLNFLLSSCRKLKFLDISELPKVSDGVLIELANSCRDLRELHLEGNEGITDKGMRDVVRSCTKLEVIKVGKIRQLTDTWLMVASQTLGKSLRSLHCWYSPRISDGGVMAIAKACEKLESCAFGSCMLISNASLEALAKNCSRLRYVDVCNCSLITEACIAKAKELLPGAKVLHSPFAKRAQVAQGLELRSELTTALANKRKL